MNTQERISKQTDQTANAHTVTSPVSSSTSVAGQDLIAPDPRVSGAKIPADTADQGLISLRLIARALEPDAIRGLAPDTLSARVHAWAEAVRAQGTKPETAIGELLPDSVWFQARLMTKSDEKTISRSAQNKNEYGRQYAKILKMLPTVHEQAPYLEALLTSLWSELVSAGKSAGTQTLPLAKSHYWIPPKTNLYSSHRNALDVFFTSVRRTGMEETGPAIRSMSAGIVVSVAGDWLGGDKIATYKKGGLSPNAGNGVIIFNPLKKRYYAYFHFKDVSVRTGQIIQAGTLLGTGGNTGTNARKKGHGNHLHVEIHETDGSAWTSYAIRDLIILLGK